jgi:ABC-2 type transport system ATP-binding protein
MGKGPYAIEIENLSKHYGDLKAVDDISININKNEVFAFLGPNGAGKTTTVEIVETIRTPTSGNVAILGLDIQKNRQEILQRIGVLPQEFSSFDRITVKETLQYYSRLFGETLISCLNLLGSEMRRTSSI